MMDCDLRGIEESIRADIAAARREVDYLEAIKRAYRELPLDEAGVLHAEALERQAGPKPEPTPVLEQPKAPKVPRPWDRELYLRRRRGQSWTRMSWMPRRLHEAFTEGERAVLKHVAIECRRDGVCAASYVRLASRAGVRRTVAKVALRRAKLMGAVAVEERRWRGRKSWANVVRITDADWVEWLESRGRKSTRREEGNLSDSGCDIRCKEKELPTHGAGRTERRLSGAWPIRRFLRRHQGGTGWHGRS